MLKNCRLEPMIELFRDEVTGSGQIPVRQIADMFPSFRDELRADVPILNRLQLLNSYDIYTLRIELRRMKIDPTSKDALKLSESKRKELTEQMKSFTRPLLAHVFGSPDQEISDVDDIFKMLSNPNRDEALANLKKIASTLNVPLEDIPSFLEEYGDIFLSLAYFKGCLDGLVPEIQSFLPWMWEAANSWQFKDDRNVQKNCHYVADSLNDIITSITGRFEVFQRKSENFWEAISAKAFREMRDLIASQHTTVGGVLCGLAVKMALWHERFSSGPGGPARRIEFIQSEILPGLKQLVDLEKNSVAVG